MEYTGNVCVVRVDYVLRGPIYGLMDGWCIMSTNLQEYITKKLSTTTDLQIASIKLKYDKENSLPKREYYNVIFDLDSFMVEITEGRVTASAVYEKNLIGKTKGEFKRYVLMNNGTYEWVETINDVA